MSEKLRLGDPEEAGMSSDRVRALRRLAAGWVEGGETRALTVLLARRGVVFLHDAFGRLGPEPDAPPLPPDAVYPLASVSKPITAAAVMTLVDEGRLGLNRPVQEYLPEFVGAGKEAVMVHHLLTHTSGLSDDDVGTHAERKLAEGVEALGDEQYPGITARPVLRCLPHLHDVPLRSAPGTSMSYCNYGYRLLAEIVERLTGQAASEAIAQRVLRPLGMRDTSFAGLDPSRADRYVRRDPNGPFGGLNRVHLLPLLAGPAGAIGTAPDLAAFGQMFLNRGAYGGARVLSRASAAAMTRDQIPGIDAVYGLERFSNAGWGYGWGIQLDKKAANFPSLVSRSSFAHGGAGGAAVLVDPEHELVLVYLSVVTRGEPGQPTEWCMDLLANAVVAAIED